MPVIFYEGVRSFDEINITYTSGNLDLSDSWFRPEDGFEMLCCGGGGGVYNGSWTVWPLDTCFISGAPKIINLQHILRYK